MVEIKNIKGVKILDEWDTKETYGIKHYVMFEKDDEVYYLSEIRGNYILTMSLPMGEEEMIGRTSSGDAVRRWVKEL